VPTEAHGRHGYAGRVFDINGFEFLVLVVVALVVVGPERLPAYAEQLGRWVRTLRELTRTAKERVASELGEEAADVDWASLDPRRYDPRHIVREALMDEVRPTAGRSSTSARRPPATDARVPRSPVTRATAAGATAAASASASRAPTASQSGTSRPGAAGRADMAVDGAARSGGSSADGSSAEGSTTTVSAPFDDEAT
jgi:sec-independent protein translocase protein TatB